ncbi:MAG: small GTP-binding protein domain protein [Planctomycetota bacterium]|nr:small GTP-binding protein domain protein [Planctomycetota bacterium]
MNASQASPLRPSATVLTGSGRGAIAVIRVRGENAVTVASELFQPVRGRPLSETPAGRPRFGRFGAERGDEVVALIVDGHHPQVEIHGHGGIAATRLVLDALASRGVEILTAPDEIPRRTWADLAAVELRIAPTLRTAQILLDQCEGALDREIAYLCGDPNAEAHETIQQLDDLITRGQVGLRLSGGWRIALAGRPNVGKSLLLNALAGFGRAVVSPIAGTTRDVVTARTAIDGWPVEIADTAGLHSTDHDLEALGIALARARIADADLVLIVLDRSAPISDADRQVILAYPDGLVVANKTDLAPAWDAASLRAIPVSASTGDGLDLLLAAIARRLVPEPPEPGSGVPFRGELIEALRTMRGFLSNDDRDPTDWAKELAPSQR